MKQHLEKDHPSNTVAESEPEDVIELPNNAANMEKDMTTKLVTYGCAAHHFNLLGKELTSMQILSRLVDIVKFFRNVHLAKAALNPRNVNKPPIPTVARWNSEADLSTTGRSYSILLKPKTCSLATQPRKSGIT